MKDELVTSRDFDTGRGEIRRLSRLWLFSRFVPLGNFAGGPGLRCLVVLRLLHGLGPWLVPLAIRGEKLLHRVHVLARRLRGGRFAGGNR